MTYYCTAWLFGEQAIDHMNALTAPDGYPPAEVWLPLDVQTSSRNRPGFRSAWAQRPVENGEVWVDVALPVDFVREQLGPRAFVYIFGMDRIRVLRSNIQMRDGQWMVKVPRFYDTVTQSWTFEPQNEARMHDLDGGAITSGTLEHLDLTVPLTRQRDEPELVVGPEGPMVYGMHDFRYRSTFTWEDRLQSAFEQLQTLPPTTPVTMAWFEI